MYNIVLASKSPVSLLKVLFKEGSPLTKIAEGGCYPHMDTWHNTLFLYEKIISMPVSPNTLNSFNFFPRNKVIRTLKKSTLYTINDISASLCWWTHYDFLIHSVNTQQRLITKIDHLKAFESPLDRCPGSWLSEDVGKMLLMPWSPGGSAGPQWFTVGDCFTQWLLFWASNLGSAHRPSCWTHLRVRHPGDAREQDRHPRWKLRSFFMISS